MRILLSLDDVDHLFGVLYSKKYESENYAQSRPIIVIKQKQNRETPECIYTLKDEHELLEYRKITNSDSKPTTIEFEFPEGTTYDEVKNIISHIKNKKL